MDRSQLLNDNEEAMRLVLDGRQSCIWTALPCIIQSVDFTSMTCEAQPAIQGTVTNENGVQNLVNLPKLVDVPIIFPSAAGFSITFPLKAGDEVLVVLASRCIDAWWQQGGIQKPMEARMHDLSDGFAIPGPKSQPNVLSAISSTTLQIRNDAGNVYIEIAANGQINIKAPIGMVIDGHVQINGTVAATSVQTIAGIVLGTHTHPVSVPSTPFTGATGAPT